MITDECQNRGKIPPDKTEDEVKAVNMLQKFAKLTKSPLSYISIPGYSWVFKGCSIHSRQKLIQNNTSYKVFLQALESSDLP